MSSTQDRIKITQHTSYYIKYGCHLLHIHVGLICDASPSTCFCVNLLCSESLVVYYMILSHLVPNFSLSSIPPLRVKQVKHTSIQNISLYCDIFQVIHSSKQAKK